MFSLSGYVREQEHERNGSDLELTRDLIVPELDISPANSP